MQIIAKKTRKVEDWVTGYTRLTDNTEAPRSFRFWTGLSMVAAALQRKCFCQFGLERMYPNMYIVLVGPSGSRKGTAMRPGQSILQEIGIPLAPDLTTHQALIRRLKSNVSTDLLVIDGKEKPMQHSSMTIFSEELTVFLGYNNAEFVTSLIDWYDCKDNWKYETISRDEDHIVGVWVNLLGASTPDLIVRSLPREAVGGGLLSRIVFVYEAKKGKLVPWPVLSDKDRQLRVDLKNDLELISTMSGEFLPDEQWIVAYMDWYEKQDLTKAIEDPRLESYLTRRATHVRKMSMILSASRSDEKIIRKSDFLRAVREIEAVEKRMHLVFSGLGQSKIQDVLSRVMSTVSVNRSIPVAELLRMYHYDADRDTMSKILATLEGMQFCRIIQRADGGHVEYIPKKSKEPDL